jgi:hypothetical protein
MLTCIIFFLCGSGNVTFPSVHAVKMIDSLAENFKVKFIDFHSH